MNNNAFLRVRDNRHVNLRQIDIFIWHPAVGLRGHVCQRRQRFIAVDNRFHQIGGIVFFTKRMQRIEHRATRLVAQRFKVAA